jgi:hypothetical protein
MTGPFAVWLEDRKHQDPVSSVTSNGEQPKHSAEGQDHAIRCNGRKVIWRAKNGLDECIPPNADDHSGEVHHSDDSCRRSVVITAESAWRG